MEHERDRLQHERARLASERDRLRRERDRLKQELAAAQRTRKRQAAPFSKGTPQSAPRKPGRKGGPKYGPKRRRDIPAQVDEELAAPLPAGCPACRGVVAHDRVEEQYQEAIVRTVRVTRIRVHIGLSLVNIRPLVKSTTYGPFEFWAEEGETPRTWYV